MASTLNVDKLFVSKLITSGNSSPIKDVPAYFLFDDTYRQAYDYILSYYSEHGSLPTLRIMRADQPKADIIAVDEP